MRFNLFHHCFRKGKLLCISRLNSTYVANGLKQNIQISEEVQAAMHAGKPLVALETTIITHGMPYPSNLGTALKVESIIRSAGAVPATIGILNGKICVGLDKSQLEFLASPDTSAIKTSRRDLPYVVSQRLNGGTTVSGTMVVAHMMDIPIFVTGGIGGVHRGAETSMDVSADLTELGRTPVTVVSAGVKSILDIGRTLEYLETAGVCVATYGTSDEFPAFFSRTSGHKSPYKLETAQQAASMIYARNNLGIQTGSLIAVPIPEQCDNLGQEIESVIQSVVMEAEEKRIQGRDVTPFILKRVNELTEGKSLEANIHLICNNAAVGAAIAVELNSLQKQKQNSSNSVQKTLKCCHGNNDIDQKLNVNGSKRKKVCVVGGSIVDFTATMTCDEFKTNGGTYAGSLRQSFGGVGRNIGDALSRLGVDTKFISAVGQDSHTAAFEAHCSHMNLDGVARLDDCSTATYCAVLQQNGELLFGIGDMNIHQQISPDYIMQFEEELKSCSLVCMDGNISVETMECLCKLCLESGVPVLFEPTDLHKASKPFTMQYGKAIVYTSPNFNELKNIVTLFSGKQIPITGTVDDLDLETVLDECSQLLGVVSDHIPITMVTLGRHGVVVCYHGNTDCKLPLKGDVVQRTGKVTMVHHPIPARENVDQDIVSVSGAGDCFVAAFISSLLMGRDLSTCVRAGLLAGEMSLYSSQAVPTELSQEAIENRLWCDNFNIVPKRIVV